MVQVLQPQNRKQPSFLQSLAGGAAEGVDIALKNYQENKRQTDAQNLIGKQHKESQRYASELRKEEIAAERGLNLKEAQGRSNVTSSTVKNPAEGILPEEAPQKNKSKSQTNRSYQPSEKLPVLPPDQIMQKGRERAQYLRDQGQPAYDEDEIARVQQENQQNLIHNTNIDKQKDIEVSKQTNYGQLGLSKLTYFEDPSPSLVEYMNKKGEEYVDSDKSAAEISKELDEEAKTIKNRISDIEKSEGPRRLINGIYKHISGDTRTGKQLEDAARTKIKPLLDRGLNDQARVSLSKAGWEAEEIENMVSNLSEEGKKGLAQFTKVKSANTPLFGEDQEYTPRDIEKINSSVMNILQTDPSTNLILLRKGFEDKNVNWKAFGDALNQGIVSGQVKLNSEQENQLKTLQEPPLSNLGYLLEKLNIRGR